MQRNKNIKRRDNNRLIPSPVGESKVLVSTLDISNIKPKSVLSFIQNIHIINTLRLESILPSNIIALSPMSISIEQKMLKSNLYSISNTKNTYISYFHQICDILHRFHSTNYIYDNLKPSNILLNKNGDIYISDYFLNEIRDLRNTNYPNIRRYLSPEQMESKEISFSTDIWSLGMILYFICEKKEYNNYNNNIRNGRIKLTNNSNYNTRLYELLINKMIKVNPSQRISLDEILLIIKRNDLTIIDDNWINSVKMYEFIKENAYILYYEYYHKLDYMLRSKIDYKLMDTSLTELNFEWSDIGDIGCEYLYDNLRSLTSVINLNLWANLISDKGLYYINLKYFNNLKYMNLGSNKISDIGLSYVVDQLGILSKLIQLNICQNLITDNGIMELSHHFTEITKLKRLDISCNLITEYGVMYLSKSITVCSTLNTLFIYGNKIRNFEKVKKKIKSMQPNQQLKI